MSQLEVAELVRYCSAPEDGSDDALLGDLQGAAEGFVQSYTRRDLDAELPGAWPVDCLHAVKMLVAHWYQIREAMAEGAGGEVPFGVRDLLSSHRDLS
ncbi:head-tail connector protein [Salipiger sp.]|uniref:head-tail connector protein n=1 Tax=Salipiger sp. TaxID=2078585 RepID=UPI003A9791F6